MWNLWMRSMRKFYDETPADGDDKGGGGGGEGDKPPDIAAAVKAMDDAELAELIKERAFNVKVAGQDKGITLAEALKSAEKVGGADSKLREAAELRKLGAEGVSIKETFDKVFKGDGSVDVKDVRKFGEMIGLSAEEAETLYNEGLNKNKSVKKDDESPKYAELSPEDREILEQAKNNQVIAAEKKIEEEVKKAVDKDEYFGKIIVDTPEDQKANRNEAIRKMVHRAVNSKILASPYTKEVFGASMIEDAIQQIRVDVEKYGIPSSSDKQALEGILSALGPIGGFSAEVQSDKKIERVGADDPNYEDTLVARMTQDMLKNVRDRKK